MNDLDDALDQYDLLCRNSRERPRLEEFLQSAGLHEDSREAALPELIAIDMEYGWRREDAPLDEDVASATAVAASMGDTATLSTDSRPRFETYARRWPEILRDDAAKIELIAEEYRIRHRWGDHPTVAEYVERFGESLPLRKALEQIDRELRVDQIDDGTVAVGAGVALTDATAEADGTTYGSWLGRYRILKRLGQGGMGEVYLAEDTKLERRVALKTPHIAKESSLRSRFYHEAKAAAALRHSAICQVYDAGEIDGTSFITMEYIEGETLSELWERNSQGSLAESVRILAQVASAVHVAHEKGIIHRDLKPSNIMIDSGGRAVVMDFGLAHREGLLRDARLTHSGDSFGTPGYMSPEQVEGHPHALGPSTDIYSLGVTLYEGITGRRPFRGSSAGAVMAQTLRDVPPTPERAGETVPADLQRLCMRMLAKQPSDRPRSMQEVANELERIAAQCSAAAVAPVFPPVALPRFGIPNRVVAACLMLFAFGAFAWAFVMRIDTEDGEVVITSFDPDLEVTVRRNGRAVDEFTFDRGAVATKVQTGEIEIEITGGNPDGAQISNGKFTLSEGEKVLVEILDPRTADEPQTASIDADSPFAALKRSDISEYELRIAGGGDPDRAPKELVAVVGDSRLAHHVGGAMDLSFHPSGEQLVSAGEDYHLRIWSTVSGEQLDSLYAGGRVLSVAYSPDGSKIAVGLADDGRTTTILQVWDHQSRERLLAVPLDGGEVHSLQWTLDGEKLVGMTRGDSIRVVVWNAATGKEVAAVEREFAAFPAIALSPDGNQIGTGTPPGQLPPQLQFWDSDTGKWISDIDLGESEGAISELVWSPDGQRMAVALSGDTQKLLVCDVDAEQVILRNQAVDASFRVDWSPDGKWLASGSREVVLWEADTGKRVRTFVSQRPIIYSTQLAFSANGKQLAATTATGAVALWDVASGHEVVPAHGHSSQVTGVNVSSDGQWIASSSRDRTVRVWAARSAAEVAVLHGWYAWFNDVAFSPDGASVAAAGVHESFLAIWDRSSNESIYILPSDPRRRSVGLSWSPNGKLVAITSEYPYQVAVMDAASGQEIYTSELSNSACVEFGPRHELLTVSDGEQVKLLEASNGEVRNEIDTPGLVRSIAFNADGTHLVVAGDFPNPAIYEVETGAKIRSLLTDRQHRQLAAVYSADGSRIATLDRARRLSYWDASSGEPLRRIQLHEELNYSGPLTSNQLAFAPDGQHLVVGNNNGTLYVLRLEEAPK